jgi:hypothetical protein
MLFEPFIDERELTVSLEKEFAGEAEKVIRDISRLAPVELRAQTAGSPPTGRQYRRGRQTGAEGFTFSHTASSLGNPPRDDSGALSKSFDAKPTGKLSGEISMLWYGAFHDENNRPFIEKAFDEAIEKAI